ncbi:uncharacterized protein BO95DRAFT_464057 [Aspergillus brunneoviolaceus CBS 621.78]|uniref:Uncharacterized protein n=1 Tax=Aspergillus brunneoviolaceus CBS 621.78 TaxID=1450534 RepID=A0ACD1G7X2_9EURO|nr:hypothetical protein BO95DRAFT_464057 [Aspergillus brunneoviolaceus CBS 621.78]RAH45244.1 hypothetical protein BO95DRAFT_464057 [Aspergillus brunneoviolaceus CBS 621.78]
MSRPLLPRGHRERLWSPMADLLSEEGYRTLRPGTSKFALLPEQVQEWPDFAKEIKALLAPYCGKAASSNTLHPVGEVADLLKLGVCFGDAQSGVNRLLLEVKKQEKREVKADLKRKIGDQQAGGKLVPDVVIADTKTHPIRGVGEVRTLWKFEPGKKQSWEQFIAEKLGQPARYMDDHCVRYGFLTIYDRTWFVKRVNDNEFAISPPIHSKARSSATEVSKRECFLAFALRASDAAGSKYSRRSGLILTRRGRRQRALPETGRKAIQRGL